MNQTDRLEAGSRLKGRSEFMATQTKSINKSKRVSKVRRWNSCTRVYRPGPELPGLCTPPRSRPLPLAVDDTSTAPRSPFTCSLPPARCWSRCAAASARRSSTYRSPGGTVREGRKRQTDRHHFFFLLCCRRFILFFSFQPRTFLPRHCAMCRGDVTGNAFGMAP